MKKTMLLLLCCTVITVVYGQDNHYREAMKKNVGALGSQNSASGLATLAVNFDRIAAVNSDQWLPFYYGSLCRVREAFVQTDKSLVDPMLDKADSLAKKADGLYPDKAEMLCLHAMIASARIMVDPRQRGAQYGPISSGLLAQALKAAPENPRVYLLFGESAFYTPAQWGGGKDKAVPLLEKSIAKFATFKPASDIAPDWGKRAAEHLLAMCKK